MHPRNRHQGQYDFNVLTKVLPELSSYVVRPYGKDTIEFQNPEAVKTLNKALLKACYNVSFWDIPEKFLCPPIPGRADYIHTIADLIGGKADSSVRVLDIGTGANVIYPLIGHAEYQWKFVGTDVNKEAVANAQKIIKENKLEGSIEVRHQTANKIFEGMIGPGETFALTMCNPPFHASAAEAMAGTERKWKNLKLGKPGSHRNFGGSADELWCPGGEKEFVSSMIRESQNFGEKVRWFTTLISKEANLRPLEKKIEQLSASDLRVLDMTHGQKKSRVLAWSFQSKLS
jgi:23S rRNA (adenine1618-N6)-methyltransferase